MNQHDFVKQVLGDRIHNSPHSDATQFAPANIALCKYWGKRDVSINLPVTDSLSVSLGTLGACTKLHVSDQDRVVLNGEPQSPDSPFYQRAIQFIDLFRPSDLMLEVDTESSIPVAAGLASSASGFAALVLALNDLFQWNASTQECSLLARVGSGSACRSIEPGFVHWSAGSRSDGMDSYATALDTTWPDFRIGLLVLESGPKSIGSRDAMNRTVETAELYQSWPRQVEQDLTTIREGILNQDLHQTGEAAEQNALAMHATMMAARPPVIYWTPDTLALIHRIHALRNDGLPVYLTMDAGPNIKVLYESMHAKQLKTEFPSLIDVAPFGTAAS